MENNNYQYREIIIPLKDKPFRKIKNLKKRAVFTLYLADFSYRQIQTLLDIDKNTVMYYVAEFYIKYPALKKPNY